ncbi:hypothetical protein J5N97_002049 [Dioscorea zingiberensis]|uniref:Uncharacterized protein n=1 Tax=Dioscorea zingiberensis TaxID=325984 RepID=A0A9D5H1W3_9LILI|nr:hypothetical protein J5N97_002049 [Dioscorea zingiberensis]
MREALGLAPKRANRAQGNRLDKHEFSELVKRGSLTEDLGEGHAEAAHLPPKKKLKRSPRMKAVPKRKRRREERKHEKHERREKRDKHEKRHSSDERKHRKDKEKRRHA